MNAQEASDGAFRFGWNEWLGAAGDLGVFIPIFILLTANHAVPATTTLLMVGLAYLVSAVVFRVPLPIQPLKAVAAIVIAKGLGLPVIMAAGLWMGLLLFAAAPVVEKPWMKKIFSLPVIKGIQFGIGLILIKAGINLIVSGRAPVSAGATGYAHFPAARDFWIALTVLVIPQLPLTLGNAVYGCADAARHYFGTRAERVSPRALCLSLGAWNLAIGGLGAMPICHGAGGMTAHVRLGARTAGATVIIGLAHILVALIFRAHAPFVYGLVPTWVLGLLVLYVGVCHIFLVRNAGPLRWLSLTMGLVALMAGGLAFPFLLGVAVEWITGLGPIRRQAATRRLRAA